MSNERKLGIMVLLAVVAVTSLFWLAIKTGNI